MGKEDFRTSGRAAPLEVASPQYGIHLIQFSPEDAEEIFALIDASRAHLSPRGDETAAKYPTVDSVRTSIESPPNPKKLRFAIRNRANILVGSINLTPDDQKPTKAEVGYYLGEEFTAQGYMTEAVLFLTSYAFDELGYTELFAKTHEDNFASAKVLKRAGYIQSGREKDHIIYTIERQKT